MAASLSPALAFEEWCKSDHAKEYTILSDNDLSGCPLDNGRHDVSNPKYGLGALDIMPVEIIDAIFLHLDMKTLTTFRRVSRRAMQALDHHLEYSIVAAQYPDVLRALLSLETASLTTLRQLHNALRRSTCVHCSSFSSYIYLLFCTRVCLSCICVEQKDYFPYPSDLISISSLGLSDDVLRGIPSFKSIPGQYGRSSGQWHTQPKAQQRSKWYHRGSIASLVQDDLSLPGAGWSNFHLRYLALMRAPVLGAEGESNRWGFGCVGCRTTFNDFEGKHYGRFDDERFLFHVDWFGNVYWDEVQRNYAHEDVNGDDHIFSRLCAP